ncbi:TPA: hypothetical protein ENX78_09605 [Candidatus Poribacteria bacterium]|nr:hypothetical protein [Candidatus Poribacteria bacterium]
MFNSCKKLYLQNVRLKIYAMLTLLCIAFLVIGCGEKDNQHLVNARLMIQQGKYKDSQSMAQIKSEFKSVIAKESDNPEALCPLKAIEIIESGVNLENQKKLIGEITSTINQLESQIKKLKAIDKDLMTDSDKKQLDKLTRKWYLTLEPTATILTSDTAWINNVGEPSYNLLLELFKVYDPSIQNNVVKIFVELKSKTFDTLIKALQNEDEMVRRQALIALGKIKDDRAVEPIAKLLTDTDPGVKFYIPIALESIGGEKIIEPLHIALKDEMSQIRMAAADIIGRLKDQSAIPLLIERLADDNSYVKASATDALMKIGTPAIPSLIDVLQKKAENVALSPSDLIGDKIGNKYKKELSKRTALQVTIMSILGNMKDPIAIKPLLEAMKTQALPGATEDEKTFASSIRDGAVSALSSIGAPAVDGLIAILSNPNESETARVSSASALGTIGDKRAVIPLINALKDGNKNVRAISASSLGILRDRRALMPLIDALNDSDIVVKTNSAASLGLIADKTATQPLLKILVDKNEREKVRTTALDSLGLIKDTTTLEPILKILIDEYEKDGIRKSAATALRLMENPYPSEALIALLRGDMVYPIYMPEKGKVINWLKKEGDKGFIKNVTPIVEISRGKGKQELLAPASGDLIKIYTKNGEEAEKGALIGLIAFKDKKIKEEERSSVRNMASLALGKVKGDNAVPALIISLDKDKNGAVRKNSASSLREIENAKARPALIKALESDDSGVVRSECAYALGVGGLKHAENVPHLIKTLQKDKYESARVKSAWSLGELADKRAVEPMIKLLVEGRKKGEKEAPAVINEIITALDKIASPAVDPLLAVLKDKKIDEVPRANAAKILGLIASTNAVEQLIASLKDESVVVRSESAKALGLINDRRAVEPLISVINNPDEWVTVRTNAITALGNIKDERAVMPLIDALKSDVIAIRSVAVTALGNIKDKRAVPLLVQMLENPKEDDGIRANVVNALASIADPIANPSILNALKDGNVTIRQNAVVAVGSLAIANSVDTLIAIVKNVNELTSLRASAAESLGNIGDRKAIGALIERLADPNESDTVWAKVATAVGKLKSPTVPEWVEQRARDTWESVTVRVSALYALSGTGSEKDYSTLVEMIDNGTLEIRAGSAMALANTGRKSATPLIIKKLESDGEETVRYYSAKALGVLADPSAEQALIKAFKEDGAASVRNESALSLGIIKGKNGINALISIAQDTTKGADHRWNSAKALGDAKITEAVPILQKMLSENNGEIHYQSAEALRKITGQKQGYEI